MRAIRRQFYAEHDDLVNDVEYFIQEIFEESLIAYASHEDVLYRIGYEVDTGGETVDVTFAEESDWTTLVQQYVPADEARQSMVAAKTSRGFAVVTRGANFGTVMTDAVEEEAERRAEEDDDLTVSEADDEIKDELGEANDLSRGIINAILRGDIGCPFTNRNAFPTMQDSRDAFGRWADIVNRTQEELISAAEEDGCDYSLDEESLGCGCGTDRASKRRAPYIKRSTPDSLARHCRDEGQAYYRDFAPWDGPVAGVTRSQNNDRVTVTINSTDEDRHGTIILPRGGRLDRYNEGNPIVLINHDHNLPAGISTVSVRSANGGDVLQANMEDRQWDLSDEEIARWHRKITMDPPVVRSASIGALFHEITPGRDFDGIEQLIDTDGRSPRTFPDVVTDWTLAEWSWVSVPSNPAATMSRSVIDRIAREAEARINRVVTQAERAAQTTTTDTRVPSDAGRSAKGSSPEADPPAAGSDQDESAQTGGTPTRLSVSQAKAIARNAASDELDRQTGRK